MKMVPLIFVLMIINFPACLAVKLNTVAPASSTMLNQVNATATAQVNQTQTKDIELNNFNGTLIQENSINNETKKLDSTLPIVNLANSEEPLVVSEQEMTLNKIKTAQSKQPNQDKLYFETLKEDADEELDDFPIVLDTNIKPTDDESMNPEAIIQRGRNQEQLENIIFDGEIQEMKEEEASEPITEEQKLEENVAKEEEPMSFSEIIQRRFKDKIVVNSASTPQEVEDMIIKPGYTANSLIDNNSWLVSFLDERRYPKMNGTLSKLYWSIHKKMPTMEELRDTSNQIADNLKQRLINSGNLILAQTNSEKLPDQRGGLSNPNKFDSESRRNVILLVCVIVQTIICCTLTKVLFVPLSQEAAYELSHRTNKRQDGKIYVLRDPVTLKYYQNIIQEAQQQKKLDKVQSKKLKRANTKRLWMDSEAGASQSGGGSQMDVGSRASKADIEQSGGGHGSRVSSQQKSKKKKKKQPHLRPSAK